MFFRITIFSVIILLFGCTHQQTSTHFDDQLASASSPVVRDSSDVQEILFKKPHKIPIADDASEGVRLIYDLLWAIYSHTGNTLRVRITPTPNAAGIFEDIHLSANIFISHAFRMEYQKGKGISVRKLTLDVKHDVQAVSKASCFYEECFYPVKNATDVTHAAYLVITLADEMIRIPLTRLLPMMKSKRSNAVAGVYTEKQKQVTLYLFKYGNFRLHP